LGLQNTRVKNFSNLCSLQLFNHASDFFPLWFFGLIPDHGLFNGASRSKSGRTTFGRMQRRLPNNTQHSQETTIDVPDMIRSPSPSR